MASRTAAGRLTAMKSRIARDVFAASLTFRNTGDVDANVSETLATRRLHHDLAHSRIDEAVHDGGVVSSQNRETIASLDREAGTTAFQCAHQPASVTSAGRRTCAHERFSNHAAKNVQ